jgi:hypothetical protein
VHYWRYGLYATQFIRGAVGEFLPDTVLYHRLLPRANRDPVLLDDKLVTKRLLASAGLPQAQLLLSGDATCAVDATGQPVALGDPAVLEQVFGDGQRVVVKPARYSSGGDGVTIATWRHDVLRNDGGQVIDLRCYGQRWGPWLVETHVQQHPALAELAGGTLNTLRVITLPDASGRRRVAFCVLKLGRGDGAVDNAHSGGLYLKVQPDTGALADTAYDESLTSHRRHPDTGVAFAGRQVPAMRQVVAMAERAAMLLPQLSMIGWDIAVTHDGPCVIEGNSSPGLTNIQRTHGGAATQLRRALSTP